MNCYVDKDWYSSYTKYFDMKPSEPLGAGVGSVACYPYTLVSPDDFWFEVLTNASKTANLVFYLNRTQAAINMDLEYIPFGEPDVIFFSGVMATAQSDDARITIIQEHCERKGSRIDRDTAKAFVELLTLAKFRGINHLALRAQSIPDRNYLNSLAKLLNIKQISYSGYPIGPISAPTALITTPASKAAVEFAGLKNYGTATDEIYLRTFGYNAGLFGRTEAGLQKFLKDNWGVSNPLVVGKFVAFGMLVDKKRHDWVFPKDPRYLANLQFVNNLNYIEPTSPKAIAAKKKLRERIGQRFRNFGKKIKQLVT